MCTILLGKEEQHSHFNIDLLNALHAVPDLQFRYAIIALQNNYDKEKAITANTIISKANHKYNMLLERKEY